MRNKNEILGIKLQPNNTTNLVGAITSNLKIIQQTLPSTKKSESIKLQNIFQETTMPSIFSGPLAPKADKPTSFSGPLAPKADKPTSFYGIKPPSIVPPTTMGVQANNPLNMLMKNSNTESEINFAKNPVMTSIASAVETKKGLDQMQSQMLKGYDEKLKEIQMNLEKEQSKNMSKNTMKALQPIFSNIRSVLNYQGKEKKKERDFDSQQYNIPLSQSLFNVNANQISSIPSWRY